MLRSGRFWTRRDRVGKPPGPDRPEMLNSPILPADGRAGPGQAEGVRDSGPISGVQRPAGTCAAKVQGAERRESASPVEHMVDQFGDELEMAAGEVSSRAERPLSRLERANFMVLAGVASLALVGRLFFEMEAREVITIATTTGTGFSMMNWAGHRFKFKTKRALLPESLVVSMVAMTATAMLFTGLGADWVHALFLMANMGIGTFSYYQTLGSNLASQSHAPRNTP